jgi:predicted helicase
VPNIDLVFFCDPRSSKVDIVQATGRALRTSAKAGKKLGYVVVPIFHEAGEDPGEVAERGALKI